MSDTLEPAATFTGATTDNHPTDRAAARAPKKAEEVGGIDRTPEAKMEEQWKALLALYMHEISVHHENRQQMAEDERFYDGEQWEADDVDVLRERGQEAITYNVIKTALDWTFGTQRRQRTDYKVLPRREDGAQGAEKKSALLKYLSDANRTEFAISKAFQDAARAGVGWLETGLQDEDEGEPIYERHESWRNVLWDTASVADDLSDARYIYRTRWVDLDTAIAMFPEGRETLELAASNTYDLGVFSDTHGDESMDEQEEMSMDAAPLAIDYNIARKRVRMIEAWYRKPEMVGRLRGGDFSGEIFDPYSQGHMAEVAMGRASVRQATAMRVRVMVMTVAGPILDSRSPYRHNRLPFTPVWGYRRGGTGMPYGMVRNLKGMQKDINKRASKALAIMSSNRVIAEEGAVADVDKVAREVARPDAFIMVKRGHRFDVDSDRGMDNAHLDMMSRTIALLQSVSGVTDENLGRETNASSGKAITARQDQGSLATSILFDNLRLARQVHGEKLLSLCEQFMTDARTFRITNMRGTPSYIAINDGDPKNDIVRTKADFIISETSWDATLRQAKSAQLVEMVQQIAPVAPEVVVTVLDLILESMDLPNGEEIVQRVRQKTGQMDPDADPNNPDEATAKLMQAKQAEAEKAGMIEQMEMARMQAETEKTAADAAEKRARTDKTTLEARKLLAAAPGDDIEAKRKALELALQMLAAPPAVPIADRLIQEAGFNFDAPPPQTTAPQQPQGGIIQ